MKVLTAAQMREVDRRTIEMGVPSLVLMENAGNRVADFLAAHFQPLHAQRIAVLCGKGNNGGDGFVVARQLFTRFHPRSLDVVLAASPEELQGDAASNYRALLAVGCAVSREITPGMRRATLVLDALLGTGISGPAKGVALDMIREINNGFPDAAIVAVDIPSGLPSDGAQPVGESVDADYTVTFTAPKIGQVLPPNCDRAGRLTVHPIGSPPALFEDDDSIFLSLLDPSRFRHLFAPRRPGGHKGAFGHVLVLAGSRGKSGAAAMAGLSALRAGAGLVTVASADSAIQSISAHAAELMTEPLPETESGAISLRAFEYGVLDGLIKNKTVLAIGPGLTTHHETVAVVERIVRDYDLPMVIDADALNGLAGKLVAFRRAILTPHPGEMARLSGAGTEQVQKDRLATARNFATAHNVSVALKGQRTLIAFPDGRVWVNPTGTPAMGTGGTGDVLTGLIAGFAAQFPNDIESALLAAVYLHGRSGELGAEALGEKSLIATDLLRFLPQAMEECASLRDSF